MTLFESTKKNILKTRFTMHTYITVKRINLINARNRNIIQFNSKSSIHKLVICNRYLKVYEHIPFSFNFN